ncbi:hypothetical protein ACFFIF_08055 [Vagococcus entomophilus]|uniref:Uncharacterized protein n=1 Tax=Vagococcus entomophilus TaxID=1160095 RepID=A0A430AH96_9ENTE|nr:hypothetical protein [Vagococcus entomophilus]RSU07285.1 hypothetical protein CBF30_08515 [Vagococcus entomophilus]
MRAAENRQRVKMFFARPFQIENIENKINDFLKEIQKNNEVVSVKQSVGLNGNYLLMTVVYEEAI